MLLSRALSDFAKNDVKVEQKAWHGERGPITWYAKKGTQTLSFYVQKHWQSGLDEVINFTYQSPHTDAMTDCFCDSYFRTLKSALGFLNAGQPSTKEIPVKDFMDQHMPKLSDNPHSWEKELQAIAPFSSQDLS